MVFFSRSKSKGHYPKHNHGGDYYKRSHGTKGILGKLFDALTGSKSHSSSYSNSYDSHYSKHKHKHGHYSNRHYRKSSWS